MAGRTRVSALAVFLVMGLVPATPALAAKTPRPVPAQTILAEWRRDVWQDPELRTTGDAGGTATTVISGVKRGGQGRWSPDGNRIGGYLKQMGNGSSYWDLAIMSATSRGTDEQTVLVGRDLDAFNVAGGHKSALDQPGTMPFGAGAWSPDGSAWM